MYQKYHKQLIKLILKHTKHTDDGTKYIAAYQCLNIFKLVNATNVLITHPPEPAHRL